MKSNLVEIKKVEVLSLAKIQGIVMFFIGIIFSIIVLLMELELANPFILTVLGIVIILPFFYGILGFLAGMVFAFLYNIIAKSFGGIKVQFS